MIFNGFRSASPPPPPGFCIFAQCCFFPHVVSNVFSMASNVAPHSFPYVPNVVPWFAMFSAGFRCPPLVFAWLRTLRRGQAGCVDSGPQLPFVGPMHVPLKVPQKWTHAHRETHVGPTYPFEGLQRTDGCIKQRTYAHPRTCWATCQVFSFAPTEPFSGNSSWALASFHYNSCPTCLSGKVRTPVGTPRPFFLQQPNPTVNQPNQP